MTTTFVMIYHPALGNVQVTVPEQAVDDYEARGWVLVDGNAPPPSSLDLTAALGDLRYLKLADVSTSGTTTGDALRAAYVSASTAAPSPPTEGTLWHPKPKATPVIIDTDVWTDTDDLMALRVALAYEKQGLLDIRAVCVSTSGSLYAPGAVDALLTDAGRPDVPIGYAHTATVPAGSPTWQQTVYQGFPHKVGLHGTGQDAVTVYRTVLAAALAAGKKVDIISIGHLNNLNDLLNSAADSISALTGSQLVTQAVGNTWIMGGQYPSGSEHNFTAAAPTAASNVCAGWPLPITFVGFEAHNTTWVGGNVAVQNAATEILASGMTSGGGPYGRPAWDPCTVRLAALGDPTAAGYTTVAGTNVVNASTGANVFTPGAGSHKYVVKAQSDNAFIAAINPLLVSGYTAPNASTGAQVYRDGSWQALDATKRKLGVASVRPASESGALAASLIMHLHADDLAALTAGTTVAHWPCRMNNLPVRQVATSGQRPTYNVKNAKNAVVFAGGQQMFTDYLHFPIEFTLYGLVWFDAAPAATQSLISSDTTGLPQASSTKNGGLKFSGTAQPLTVLYNGGTSTVNTHSTAITTGAWHTVAARYSPTVGTFETFLDGVKDTPTAYTGLTPRYLPINVGGRAFDGGTEFLTGSVREVRAYATRHDDATVANVLALMT